VAETPDRGGAQAEATISFQKLSQSITFNLEASTLAAGTTLTLSANSTSGLPVAFASSNSSLATINGTTLTGLAAGNVTLTASQAGNDHFSTAENILRSLEITPGSSFASLFPNQSASSDADNDGIPAFIEYVLGGTSSSNDAALLPQAVRDGNTLRLTAVVRSNDPTLLITAQSSTSLSGSWAGGLQGTDASDQSGVATGFTRRIFTFDATSSTRAFMRLHVQSPPP
jgi:hypothetical protein